MEYLADFILFLAKTVVLLGGIAMVITLVVSLGQKNKKMRKGHLEINRLNEHYEHMQQDLQYALLTNEQLKATQKAEKEKAKADKKAEKKAAKAAAKKAKKSKGSDESDVEVSDADLPKPRLFILDFDGDMRASAVDSLREEITAMLSIADKERDEVLVRLESGGGMVHAYGLASSQLQRIKDFGLKLTVSVDKVAASGGYMMACIANDIVAAPFAVVGSIGVVAQLPNFNKLLKKHDVDIELHTAGQYKRTLTTLGENTEEGRAKFIEDLEETHQLFKDFVKAQRPQVDIDKVATGEIWYGQTALDVQLVDSLGTSDEFIYSKVADVELIQLRYEIKQTVAEKFGLSAASVMDATVLKWWDRMNQARFQ